MSGLAERLQLAQLAGCFCRPVSLMKVRLADAKDVKCQKAPARKDEVNLFALQLTMETDQVTCRSGGAKTKT